MTEQHESYCGWAQGICTCEASPQGDGTGGACPGCEDCHPAAQPAAGTGPHVRTYQQANCPKCHERITVEVLGLESTGTTPQAERPKLADYENFTPAQTVWPAEALQFLAAERCGNCDHHTELHNIHGCTVRIQLEDGKTMVDCPCAWDNLQAGDEARAVAPVEPTDGDMA